MNTQLMVKPSSLMPQGIKMVDRVWEYLLIQIYRRTPISYGRTATEKKTRVLTADEIPELAGIIELSRIFTFINAQLSTQAKWCPIELDNELSNGGNGNAVSLPNNN